MTQPEKSTAQICNYSFEVAIAKSAEAVWPLMIEKLNDWWMSDFRVLGAKFRAYAER